MIAGVDGALLDHLRAIEYSFSKLRLWYLLYWLLGTILALWTFVYIINARNGIAVTTILYGFWLISALVFFIRSQICGSSLKSALAFLILGISFFCLILFFAFLQSTVIKGWQNFFQDARIAVQIDH
jgi:hypothetical protein